MIPAVAKTFTYRINWRSRSAHIGPHQGLHAGVGMEYRDSVALTDYPDARRIDISQTIRDLSEQVRVRVFNQKNPACVYAVCDLSGSMRFRGSCSKMAVAARVAASIANSAYQAADRFSFVGFDKAIRNDWLIPSGSNPHEAMQRIGGLAAYQPAHAGAEGLLDVERYLGRARGLVFLMSDFHLPLAQLEQALNMLSRHHVVPLVLWDSAEYRNLPRFGLGTIVDPETGEQRTLFFRRALRRKFEELFQVRREQLKALFMRYEMPPFFIEDDFDADALSAYFHQFSAL